MLPIVWDLDGTIVSTREANVQAYRSLGVEPPVDFHLRHWTTWVDKSTHDAKGRMFPKFVEKYVTKGPCWDLYNTYGGPILTMASPEVINAVADYLNTGTDIYVAESSEDKVHKLNSVNMIGVYIDDSEKTCDLVSRLTRWIVIPAHVASSLPQEKVVALLSSDIPTRPRLQ